MTTQCACGCGAELAQDAIDAGAEYLRNHYQRLKRTGVPKAKWEKAKPMPEPRKCACGCDGWIPPKHGHRYKQPKFIHGHQRSVMPIYRYKQVPEDVKARTGLCACGCGQRAPISDYTVTRLGRYRGYPMMYAQGHGPRKAPGTRRNRPGRGYDSQGYIRLYRPEHPNATKYGNIQEHRVVMELVLGRYLYPEENVHHRNGVRDDNRPENLELWVKPQPAGQRVDDLVAWVVEHYPERVRSALA